MSPVQILIADDHELFRRTVRSFIESQPDYRVCAEACDGIEAIEKVRELRPDIVLMDINMPRMDGLEATRVIRREMPECNVIIVTQNHPTIAREQARTVDAKGSVTKSDLTRDLFPTIKKVFEEANPAALNLLKEEAPPVEDWVRAGGALGKLVRDFDWAHTPLGAIEQWPQSLKTIVRVMLTSRFAMWMSWGPELTFLYNDAYAKMTLGKKHPWALGKPSHLVWEEIWHDIGPRIRKVLETGESTWDEGLMLFLERSGYREETYHTFSYSPLAGDDGKVVGHLCVVTEETDRVIGERRLKTLRSLASELSKATTEENVVAAVSRSLSENEQDLPFTLTYFLSGDATEARLACRTGMAPDHPAAVPFIDLNAGGQVWPIKDLLGGRDSVSVEDLGLRFHEVPTGAWKSPPTRTLCLPIMAQAQGNVAGVFIAALNPYRPLDVSYAGFLSLIAGQIAASIANARAYEEERKRAEALAEVDRAKTLFFSNVSHEFRTPLTLMLGPLEDMLAESRMLAPQQQERLEIAHRNSMRLLKLVNTLLDFSRIEAGRFQASYEPTDLAQLTAELASVFRSAIEKAGLRLVVNCSVLDEPVYVDRELWEKIVFNLLSNAFKFTFEGEIEVSIRRTEAGAELSVRDTGTGIPADDLGHLFERFYRVKNARGRTFEGSGIGLALVQELAKQHGGTVRVESEFGRGSRFAVTIPFGADHLPVERLGAGRTLESTALRVDTYVEEAMHWLPETRDITVPSGSLSLVEEEALAKDRARIVLADDNADMREYVRNLLSTEYQVIAVPDGEAALNAVRERRPDLVLTDVMMPKLDGFGLLRALRADEEIGQLPVILLSARAGEESRVEGLTAGADDYLVKPFSARELMARVRSHLAMSKVRRQASELERTLREHAEAEQRRLEELFMQSPAGFAFLSGPEHRFTFVNTEYVKSSGRTGAHEFVGKRVDEVFPELKGLGFWEILDEVYRTGVPYVGTATKVPLKAGANSKLKDVYYDFTYQPFRGATGKVEGILVHAVDVTERKLAEEAVREREAELVRDMKDLSRIQQIRTRLVGSNDLNTRLAEILSAATDVMGTDKGNIQLYDAATCRLRIVAHQGFGEKFLERFMGQGSPFVCDLAAQKVKRMVWEDIAKEPALEGTDDLRVILDDNIRAIQSTPLLSLDGRLLGLINNHFRLRHRPSERDFYYLDVLARMAADFIERWQADNDLRQSEQRFRALADNLEEHVRQRTVALEKAQDELRDLSAKVLRAQDEERRRIARELHDSAGQTLTILGMNLARVANDVQGPAPEALKHVQASQELVQQLHNEIRTTSYLLHPPLLDESGLASAIGWYIEGISKRSGLEIGLEVSDDFGRVPKDRELVVFRIVQECLTNIHRHSDAKRALIRLSRSGEDLKLSVEDNGKGMSPRKLREIQSGGSGVGIRGMRERVRQFQGEMTIDSDSSGTRISVVMPIAAADPGSKKKDPEPLQATV